MKFLDQAKIYIRAGNGGAGCVSFRREARVEKGGPDGGDGGRGGHVYAECVKDLNTLIDYRYRQHFKGGTGGHGMGKNRTGKAGKDIILALPVGTQIFADDNITLIADLTEIGQRVLLAKGGNGGFGNTHFKGAVNQAPRHANDGQEGREAQIWLRLKLIADIGLIGQPNAGKSTLLACFSRAKPKIADYPFTTLHPHLGVVGARGEEFVMADIPGLIAGAADGAGLGHRFLGHIERCRLLLHVIDGSLSQEEITASYNMVRGELAAYDDALVGKEEIVALNKCDIMQADDIKEKKSMLETLCGKDVYIISGASGARKDILLDGLQNALRHIAQDTAQNNNTQGWHALGRQ